MAGEENAAWEGERGGKARDTHHVREFHLCGSADVRLCEERGGSWADGQPGASRGTDTFWFWTRVSFFWEDERGGGKLRRPGVGCGGDPAALAVGSSVVVLT